MKFIKKHIGNKLHEALEAAGMNQSELAEKLGVEQPTVSRWRNGKDLPEEARFEKLCQILKVPEEFFISSENKPTSPFEKELVAAVREIRDEAKKGITSVVKELGTEAAVQAKLTAEEKQELARLREFEAHIKTYGPDLFSKLSKLNIFGAERIRLALELPALTVPKAPKSAASESLESSSHHPSKKKSAR